MGPMRVYALELAKTVDSNFYDQYYFMVLDHFEKICSADNHVDNLSKKLSAALARAVKAASSYKKVAAADGDGVGGRVRACRSDKKEQTELQLCLLIKL